MKKLSICLIAGLTCFAVISITPSPTATDSSNDDETDPSLLQSETIVWDASGSGLCEVLPIAVHVDTVLSMHCSGGKDDLLQGSHEPKGGFGWLSWNGDQSASWLSEELRNPSPSATHFHNEMHFDDTVLNLGVWINSFAGAINSNDVREAMDWFVVGRTVLLPVYDAVAGAGKNGRYHVVSLARFTIDSFELPQGQKKGLIIGTFLELATDKPCGATVKSCV